jgi:hypothetical protein
MSAKTITKALLERVRICEPQLIRIYAAEYEKGGAIATAKNAEQAAKEVLPPVHNCQVRLVGLDCPSLEIGKQIAGQMYDQLPWATVSTTPTGELIDQGWHKGRLTDQERIRQTARDQHVRFAAINAVDQATEDFRRVARVKAGL